MLWPKSTVYHRIFSVSFPVFIFSNVLSSCRRLQILTKNKKKKKKLRSWPLSRTLVLRGNNFTCVVLSLGFTLGYTSRTDLPGLLSISSKLSGCWLCVGDDWSLLDFSVTCCIIICRVHSVVKSRDIFAYFPVFESIRTKWYRGTLLEDPYLQCIKFNTKLSLSFFHSCPRIRTSWNKDLFKYHYVLCRELFCFA